MVQSTVKSKTYNVIIFKIYNLKIFYIFISFNFIMNSKQNIIFYLLFAKKKTTMHIWLNYFIESEKDHTNKYQKNNSFKIDNTSKLIT